MYISLFLFRSLSGTQGKARSAKRALYLETVIPQVFAQSWWDGKLAATISGTSLATIKEQGHSEWSIQLLLSFLSLTRIECTKNTYYSMCKNVYILSHSLFVICVLLFSVCFVLFLFFFLLSFILLKVKCESRWPGGKAFSRFAVLFWWKNSPTFKSCQQNLPYLSSNLVRPLWEFSPQYKMSPLKFWGKAHVLKEYIWFELSETLASCELSSGWQN